MKLTQCFAALTLIAGAAASAPFSAYAAGDPTIGQQRVQALGCPTCHGADGNGARPRVANVPRLAGQHADYLVRALKAYGNGGRKNPIMRGFAGALTPADRENIAAYFASRTGLVTLHRR